MHDSTLKIGMCALCTLLKDANTRGQHSKKNGKPTAKKARHASSFESIECECNSNTSDSNYTIRSQSKMNLSNSIYNDYKTSSGVSISPYPTVISNSENNRIDSQLKNSNSPLKALNHASECSSSSLSFEHISAEEALQIEPIVKDSQEAVVRELNSGADQRQIKSSLSVADSPFVPLPTFYGAQLVRNSDGRLKSLFLSFFCFF